MALSGEGVMARQASVSRIKWRVEQWDAPGETVAQPASPMTRPAIDIPRIGAVAKMGESV
jgi:hypothetical protein